MGGKARGLAVAMTLGLTAVVGGCGSISEFIAERGGELPGVGLPEGAPERPVARAAYPAVHDMPPPRDTKLLNEDEQRKIEDDLMAARARNQEAGGQPVTPVPPPSKPAARDGASATKKPASRQPAARQPSSSRGSIY